MVLYKMIHRSVLVSTVLLAICSMHGIVLSARSAVESGGGKRGTCDHRLSTG